MKKLIATLVGVTLFVANGTSAAFATSYTGVSNVQISASGQPSGGLLVTWTNPVLHEDFGGFEVRVKSSNGDVIQRHPVEDSNATQFPVTGLTNGSEYTAEVATLYGGAPNDQLAVGSGNAVPYDVPSAPAKPTASRTGAGEVTLNWVAPANNGNAISGYTVSCSPDCPEGPQQSTTLSAVITGLTTSTPYTFTVIATNERGDSVASISSDSVTPHANVTAPSGLVMTAGDSQVNASWTAASISGATVSSYSVQLFLETAPSIVVQTKSVTTTSTTFTGLTNGVRYFFKVSTVVGAITSAPATSLFGLTAAAVVVTPPAPPAPPSPPAPPAQVVTAPVAPPVVVSAPAAPAPAAPAQPAMRIKQKTTSKSLANQIGMSVTPKAKIKLTVAKSSRKICKVSKGKLVALKRGNCLVTVAVTPKKTKKIKKPKAIKRSTVVAIS